MAITLSAAPMPGGRDLATLALTREERGDLATMIHEFAGRVEREKGAGAKKRADRYREIAREIRGFLEPGDAP